MPSMNLVVLAGNLTRDPELRTLTTGNPIAKFGMAINRKYTNKRTGELKEDVVFVDVDAFGRTGEVISQYFHKGDAILITGRLQYDRWEDADGKPRNKLKVIADRFSFVDGRRQGGREPEFAGVGSASGGAARATGIDDVPF